jgi:hypothetical protein
VSPVAQALVTAATKTPRGRNKRDFIYGSSVVRGRRGELVPESRAGRGTPVSVSI